MSDDKNNPISMEDADKVTGSMFPADQGRTFDHVCKKENAYRTGNDREDSRFIFFSQHQYEYVCQVCGQHFWVDEERS